MHGTEGRPEVDVHHHMARDFPLTSFHMAHRFGDPLFFRLPLLQGI